MAHENIHFELQPGSPDRGHWFTERGNLWKMEVRSYLNSKAVLVDGENCILRSNNPLVVPNDDVVFLGKTGGGKRRVITFYSLLSGTTLIDAFGTEGGPSLATLQVHVVGLPGDKPSFVALDGPHTALNSPDTPVPYKLKQTITVKPGERAEDFLKKVDPGSRHLAISCHGTPDGVLLIGEGLNKKNADQFGILLPTAVSVIWIGGCSVAGTVDGVEFCKQIAKQAAAYVVAPGIVIPPTRPGIGRVELFERSLPHYFNRIGEAITAAEFFKQSTTLGFKVE